MRRVRTVLEDLGHETFVLARPTRKAFQRRQYVERSDAWDQPGVTEASRFHVPWQEYERWLDTTRAEVVFCFQNYAFDEVRRMRERGVRTIGTFMWEAFGPEHVEGAASAYDIVYSLTRSGRARFAELGIEGPYVPWGCHPDDIVGRDRTPGGGDAAVTYYVPAGYVSRRKPLAEIMEAFHDVEDPRLRLVVKLQGTLRGAITVEEIRTLARRDQRVSIVDGDLPTRLHTALFAASDVCLAPSRWEGLGLHLFEALAMGIPVITTATPPMDEVVRDGREGVLVPCSPAGKPTRSGVPAVEPDPQGLRAAIAMLADDDLRAGQAGNARAAAVGRLSWERTRQGYRDLLAQAQAG